MKATWIIIALGIILLMALGIYYFSSSKSEYNPTLNNENVEQNISIENPPLPPISNTPVAESPTAEAQGYNIEISGYAFKPAILTVNVGDTVIWTNKDFVKHTVTSDAGSELDSKLIGNAETYSHTFNSVGTYNYHCTPHPSMKGAIVVQ